MGKSKKNSKSKVNTNKGKAKASHSHNLRKRTQLPASECISKNKKMTATQRRRKTSKQKKGFEPRKDSKTRATSKTPTSTRNSRKKLRSDSQDAGEMGDKVPVKHHSQATLSSEYSEDKYTTRRRNASHNMDDLGGIDDIKASLLRKVIGPFAYDKKASILKLDVPRGILLVGKPGTGKTVLADGIVNEIKKLGRDVCYFVETGSCLSKYLGESEKNIREVFAAARRNAPSILFLDEIDGIGRKRDSSSISETCPTILTTLLTELNEVERGNVLLIAATNCPESVDPALIRKGRFDVTYHIPSPNDEARKQILEVHLKKRELKVGKKESESILKATDGLVGSDLEALVKDIHMNAVDRVFPNLSWGKVTDKQLSSLTAKVQNIHMKDVTPALKQIFKQPDSENFEECEE